MKKFLAVIFSFLIFANVTFAATSYDRYGQKTGSYRQSGSTINQYDRYGQRTGSFKNFKRLQLL